MQLLRDVLSGIVGNKVAYTVARLLASCHLCAIGVGAFRLLAVMLTGWFTQRAQTCGTCRQEDERSARSELSESTDGQLVTEVELDDLLGAFFTRQ